MATIDQKIVDIFHLDTTQIAQLEQRIAIDDTINEQWLLNASQQQVQRLDYALRSDPYYVETPREESYPVIIYELSFMVESMKDHGYTLDDYIYLTQDVKDPLEADTMIRIYKDRLDKEEKHLSPRQYYDYFTEILHHLNDEIYKSLYSTSQESDNEEVTVETFNEIIEKYIEENSMLPDDSIFTKIEDIAIEKYKANINDDGELIVPFDKNDNFGMIMSQFPPMQEVGVINMMASNSAQDYHHFSSGFIIDYQSQRVIWENVSIPMILYHHETIKDIQSIGIIVRIINQKETIEKIGVGGVTVTSPRYYFGAWLYHQSMFEGGTDQETFDAITTDPYTGEMLPPEEGLDVISTHSFLYREKNSSSERG